MSKRGRKPGITHDQRLRELRRHPIFDDHENLKKEGDIVWSRICTILEENHPGKTIKPKNLYTYVAQNRCNILCELTSFLSDNQQECERHEDVIAKESEDSVQYNVEEEMIKLQSDALLKPSIKEICTWPFTIFHWSIEAVDIVSSLNKNIQYIFGVVGSMCERFKAPDKSESGTIFLYALGVNVEQDFIPICQLSTEKTMSIPIFTRFFNMCFKGGLSIPWKLSTDFTWNQYTAANSAFNVNLKYERYLVICFEFLQGESKVLPRCLIHTNSRFLILKVLQWECVKNHLLKGVKYFYIYCVILLSMQNTLDDFDKVLEKIFIFTYSKFQNQNSTDCFNFIKTKYEALKIDVVFSRDNIKKIENDYQEIEVTEKNKNLNYEACQTIVNHMKYIFVKAKECVNKFNGNDEKTPDENAFFSKDFCKHLIQICTEFVIWSNVICKHDENSTEDYSIKLLNSYKDEFQSCLVFTKTTADNFLMKNIDYVDEKLQILRASVPQVSSITNKDTKPKHDFDNTYLLHEENWMGKNPPEKLDYSSSDGETSVSYTSESEDQLESISDENNEMQYAEKSINEIVDSVCQELSESQIEETNAAIGFEKEDEAAEIDTNNYTVNQEKVKSKPRGKFLKPCQEIHLLHQKPQKNTKHRYVIKNYNLIKTKKVNKNRLSVLTSSFFDSILEILTSIYFNISQFQIYIDNPIDIFEGNKQEFIIILQKYVSSLNVNTLYTDRAAFLSTVCYEKHNNKLCWTKSIGDFFVEIVYPNIISKLLCLDCDTFVYQCLNRVKLSPTALVSEDLSELIYNVLEKTAQISCQDCQQKLILYECEMKHLLCIDVEDNDLNGENYCIKLENIRTNITIGKQILTLVGLIEFQKPIGSNQFRHYLAYCRNSEGFWLKFDDIALSDKPIKIKIKDKSVNTALAIYSVYKSIA